MLRYIGLCRSNIIYQNIDVDAMKISILATHRLFTAYYQWRLPLAVWRKHNARAIFIMSEPAKTLRSPAMKLLKAFVLARTAECNVSLMMQCYNYSEMNIAKQTL